MKFANLNTRDVRAILVVALGGHKGRLYFHKRLE